MSRATVWAAGLAAAAVLAAPPAEARISFATVPPRDAVQLTIYNSADITLVRERRTVTLAKGANRLEFAWAGTLIDPTSVDLKALGGAAVEVIDVSFPAEAPNALVWTVEAPSAGPVDVEVTYFTSGLTWAADYEFLLDGAGARATIASHVKVTNRSGESYDAAEVRLVVGTIQLVEPIADLARRREEGRFLSDRDQSAMRRAVAAAAPMPLSEASVGYGGANLRAYERPEIVREGLSEYFLYTVSGRQEAPDGWSVRWRMFEVGGVPVESLYKQEDGRYDAPRRFLALKNDAAHRLGEEPLPDGEVRVFRARADRTRRFEGRARSRYVPLNEEWEIDLGLDPEVSVKAVRRDFRVENVETRPRGVDRDVEVVGWDAVEAWEVVLLNSRPHPVRFEVDRNFGGDHDYASADRHERYDIDTVRLARTLGPRARETIRYEVTYRRGTRARR